MPNAACVEYAISLLTPGARVLDVDCGTGIPTSQMLADAGMIVYGTDVAPNMVKLAKERVRGTLVAADMCDYVPEGKFAAIFILYSHLGLKYAAFRATAFKLSKGTTTRWFVRDWTMPDRGSCERRRPSLG